MPALSLTQCCIDAAVVAADVNCLAAVPHIQLMLLLLSLLLYFLLLLSALPLTGQPQKMRTHGKHYAECAAPAGR
jgi:hypothetical protein